MSLITSLIPALATAPAAPTNSPEANLQEAERVPTVTPRHEIAETSEAFGVTVDLPGVAKGGLEVSVDHEQIRITGRRDWRKPDGWTALHRESVEANYELVLEHGRTIDADKVQAELRDGVLRVSLPKAGALKPRKIAVA